MKKLSQKKLSRKKIFYVYGHYKKDNGQIFYVGKGQDDRAYHLRRGRFWKFVAKKHGYTVEIIKDGLTEKQAYALEKKLIKKYGRIDNKTGILVNHTDGGEGHAGNYKDYKIYHFKHIDGREERTTRHSLAIKYGFSRHYFKGLFHNGKKKRLTANGWYLAAREKEVKEKAKLNGNFDHEAYHFKHIDGREERLTRFDLGQKYGFTSRDLRAVISGKTLQFQGWYLAKHEARFRKRNGGKGLGNPAADKTKYDFRHIDGGNERLTQWELAQKYGLNRSGLSKLVRGKSNSTQGWYLKGKGNKARAVEAMKISNHLKDVNIYHVKHVDGREEKLDRYAFVKKYGIATGHFGQLINKRISICKGWFLANREKELIKLRKQRPYLDAQFKKAA